jgi:hypothetical protein
MTNSKDNSNEPAAKESDFPSLEPDPEAFLSSASWLGEVFRLSKAVEIMSECLARLADKRETLEEKMIKSYLHRLSISCCVCIEKIHQRFLDSSESLQEAPGEPLTALTEQLVVSLADFVKIVRYNLNFLEQYYEYDFHMKLISEWRFQERIDEILSQLSQ